MSFPPNLGITSPFIIYSKPPSPLFQEFPSLLLPTLQQLHSQFSTNKMTNGYSRIKKISSTRSQSVDLTDLSSPNQTPTAAPNYSNFSLKSTTPNHITTEKNIKVHDSLPKNNNEDGAGEVFGVILSRKFPIPSPKVNSELQQQKSSFDQNVGKKSVSVKRSVSVSEGYCRIHHQSESTAAEDDQNTAECNDQKSYTKKRGKLLKACRRLFGM